MATNFDLAPPPVMVDGNAAVPIDISAIEARLTFDGAAGTASGDATLTFVVGSAAGRPIFDLRQTITGVWLDGAPLAVGQILRPDHERVLELVRPQALGGVAAAVVPRTTAPRPAPDDIADALEYGRLIRRRDEAPPDASDGIALADAGFTLDGARPFPPGPVSRLPVRLPLGQSVLGLRLDVAAGQAGAEGTIDLVLRDDHGKPAGGIAIALTVA